ncbi:MAG: YciI family protein [Candidatus Campbellbacteria bacterium]|nr:YciI family protein [Candidatus Campbellbacteria bacterium]
MKKFLFFYCGTLSFNSPEEAREHMRRWVSWLESIKKFVFKPGIPLKDPKKIGIYTVEGAKIKDKSERYDAIRLVTKNPISINMYGFVKTSTEMKKNVKGYSIMQANDLEEVIKLIRTCPHLRFGFIDIVEVREMKMLKKPKESHGRS